MPKLSALRRPLILALLVSLLLHGALLLRDVRPFSPLLEGQEARMQVVMLHARRPLPGVPPKSPERKLEEPSLGGGAVPLKPKVTDRRPKQAYALLSAPTTVQVPTPVPVPPPVPVAAKDVVFHPDAVPAFASSEVQPGGNTSPGAVVLAPAVSSASADSTVTSASPSSSYSLSGQSGESGSNADALRQYRVLLASAARRFKRYPALARERGWEGVPEVLIVFRANGSAPEVKLAHSCGRSILDDQAVDMIRQAVLASQLSDDLKGQGFRVQMPVKFSLESD